MLSPKFFIDTLASWGVEFYTGVPDSLLKNVCALIAEKGYSISNIDATVIAQKPKLKPYIAQMRAVLAEAMRLDEDCISIKATTEEKLGFTGRLEGISAHCVSLIFSTTA